MKNPTFLELESAYNNAKLYLNKLRRTAFDYDDENSPEALEHERKINLQRKIVTALYNKAFPKTDRTHESIRYN